MFLIFLPHEAQLLSWALSLDSANMQICSQFNMPEIGMYRISKQWCLIVAVDRCSKNVVLTAVLVCT